MAKIIKVYEQDFPALKLIGKIYHGEDRDEQGTFSTKWCEWFASGYFDKLEETIRSYPDTGYVGAMRMNGDVFEYWIGMLTDKGEAPEGYTAVDIPAQTAGIAWIKGTDGPELYSMHDECMAAYKKEGYAVAKNAWYIEDYVCPRFTEADKNGEVILDYMVSIEK